jgi:hypothetical protein
MGWPLNSCEFTYETPKICKTLQNPGIPVPIRIFSKISADQCEPVAELGV